MIGVYVIKCVSNGRFYVGSSRNIKNRKRTHLKQLRKGKHHNAFLQRVYDKYGEDSFKFSYRLTDTQQEALLLEQHYLYSHMFNSKCMNIGLHAVCGDNLTRHPERAKIIAKIKATQFANLQAMSIEEKKRLFGRAGSKNGMYGKSHSKETRAKMSSIAIARGGEHLRGIRKSEEGRRNMVESARKRVLDPNYVNPFKGKTHSEEAKRRMGEANKGKRPANARRIRVGKKKFNTLRECAKALGVADGTICYRIGSVNFPEYTYIE